MNEQLVQRIRTCSNLPSLPSVAVQVVELAQRPDADIAEIARLISKDPALSGKILRTVNSSFYGRSQNVSTISQALVILGLQSVKTLVLGFTLVTTLSRSKSSGFKHLQYWKHSIYAATAARTLAAQIGFAQREEAFLASLLADIGMLVLDMCVGEPYGKIHAGITSHAQLASAEKEALGLTHAQIGGILAEHWNLPRVLRTPIAFHDAPEAVRDPALRKLAELVQVSSCCADVFADAEPAPAIAEVRRLCHERYQLTGLACDAAMNQISERTREVASLFEINIGSPEDYEAILKQANEALVQITLQTQQQAARLRQQNSELQQAATTDGLTGLNNRSRFDAFLAEAFQAAVKSGKPLALVMIDVDRFKQVNDTHGHPGGDAVLRVLGKLLKASARPTDLAARYGGEEMVLCLPNTTRIVAAQIAERIRQALCAAPVQAGRTPIGVTASFGVAAYESTCPFTSAVQLLRASDLALYHAKQSGRNCVKIFTPQSSPRPAAA